MDASLCNVDLAFRGATTLSALACIVDAYEGRLRQSWAAAETPLEFCGRICRLLFGQPLSEFLVGKGGGETGVVPAYVGCRLAAYRDFIFQKRDRAYAGGFRCCG